MFSVIRSAHGWKTGEICYVTFCFEWMFLVFTQHCNITKGWVFCSDFSWHVYLQLPYIPLLLPWYFKEAMKLRVLCNIKRKILRYLLYFFLRKFYFFFFVWNLMPSKMWIWNFSLFGCKKLFLSTTVVNTLLCKLNKYKTTHNVTAEFK